MRRVWYVRANLRTFHPLYVKRKLMASSALFMLIISSMKHHPRTDADFPEGCASEQYVRLDNV